MLKLNKQAINAAFKHFEGIHGKRLSKTDEAFPIVPALTPDGAVQYQTYQFNEAPEELQEAVKIGKVLMERFVAIASAAFFRKGGGDSPENYKFEVWNEVVRRLLPAFFTNPVSGDRKLHTTVKGVDIAQQVINFAGSVVAGNVADFASFLKGFGEGLSLEMSKTEAEYNYLYSYSTHNIFQNDSGVIFYEPKLLVYGTHFSHHQKDITTSCGSYESIELDFKVFTIGGNFRIEQYMSDDNFKKEVDNFLTEFEGKNIADTKSYFSGIFEAEREVSSLLAS